MQAAGLLWILILSNLNNHAIPDKAQDKFITVYIQTAGPSSSLKYLSSVLNSLISYHIFKIFYNLYLQFNKYKYNLKRNYNQGDRFHRRK